MTEQMIFSGPREYERYTPYVVIVQNAIEKAFHTKRAALTFAQSLPYYVYARVMTRKQFERAAK